MLKSEIITRLIKDGHITIEEAVILMEKEIVYMKDPFNPYIPPLVWTTGLNTYATNSTAKYWNGPSTLTKN